MDQQKNIIRRESQSKGKIISKKVEYSFLEEKVGVWTHWYYYENGELESKKVGIYENGEKNGEWKSYDAKGKLTKIENY